jgi:hypothetical protein
MIGMQKVFSSQFGMNVFVGSALLPLPWSWHFGSITNRTMKIAWCRFSEYKDSLTNTAHEEYFLFKS